jgi:hypothetical protein
MPVEGKLVVIVGDKSVDVKPIIDGRKDIATCITLPVCVDAGIQTDDICVEDTSGMREGGRRVRGDSH